ncbi:hypothetical protein [uncultured Dysosmobacter sp.]|uniref:hypothetical protein n=1 Tax=uncultured Dysosmobacter sp. TaxID=2591384 RepID=UPI00263297C8|nr:hypothetical protein [uncultured Dysosmobacter sp.]
MKKEDFFEALCELDDDLLRGAETPVRKKMNWRIWGTIAACFAVFVAISGILSYFNSGMVVTAYACGTDEEITEAGAVIHTGTISDTGEMKGHPLMFYLSGEDIETVRFSCKNHQINFMDWTETRDEYGEAQNFTVTYGEDESEYYYLTIDWVPNTIIRALTDNPETTIATLPAELREDIIVMEITFANGKTATKAITVSLLEDGTFFATFDNYKVSEADDFIKRTDSVAIPRNILYGQGSDPAGEGTPGSGGPVRGGAVDDMPQVENRRSDDAETAQPAAISTHGVADAPPMVYVNGVLYKQSTEQISYGEMKEEFICLGKIESTASEEGVPKEDLQANDSIVGCEVYQYGENIVVHIGDAYWLYTQYGEREVSWGNLSEQEKKNLDPAYRR